MRVFVFRRKKKKKREPGPSLQMLSAPRRMKPMSVSKIEPICQVMAITVCLSAFHVCKWTILLLLLH